MGLWLIKVFTCFFALGVFPDFIAQKITRPALDWKRLLYMGLMGALVGILIVETFFKVMGHFYPQEAWLPRLLWDQLFFGPTNNAFVMVMVYYLRHWMEGDWNFGPVEYLKRNYLFVQLRSWAFWGPASALIYMFLPDSLKLFGQNGFALVWGVIMSLAMHRRIGFVK